MHEVLVNRLGGLSLPRKPVVRLTDRPDMTLDVYRGGKTTMQQFPPHWGLPLKERICSLGEQNISFKCIPQKMKMIFSSPEPTAPGELIV